MHSFLSFTSRTILVGCLAFALRAGDPPRPRGEPPGPRDAGAALAEARAELEELKQTFTETHPRVREQRARIAALEGAVRPPQPGGQPRGPMPGQPMPPQPPGQPGPHPQPWGGPFPPHFKPISVDFPGGTLNDLLALIAKNPEVSLSVINAGEPADLATPVPAFVLRNTTAPTILQVLARLLNPRGLELSPVSGDDNSVVALLVRHDPARPGPVRAPPTEFESFQLGPFLGETSVDDVVAAIRTAWELDPHHDASALRLKFHPPTSILLVSGPREGLSMAMKIISQLKPSTKIRPDSSPRPPSPPTEKR